MHSEVEPLGVTLETVGEFPVLKPAVGLAHVGQQLQFLSRRLEHPLLEILILLICLLLHRCSRHDLVYAENLAQLTVVNIPVEGAVYALGISPHAVEEHVEPCSVLVVDVEHHTGQIRAVEVEIKNLFCLLLRELKDDILSCLRVRREMHPVDKVGELHYAPILVLMAIAKSHESFSRTLHVTVVCRYVSHVLKHNLHLKTTVFVA